MIADFGRVPPVEFLIARVVFPMAEWMAEDERKLNKTRGVMRPGGLATIFSAAFGTSPHTRHVGDLLVIGVIADKDELGLDQRGRQ
jgi:hypothetical protein